MSAVYVELIENFLSSELGVGFDSTALAALDGLTEQQLDLFHHQWGEVDRRQHELMAQSRPFTPEPDDTPSRADDLVADQRPDIRPTSALFTHPYNDLTALDLNLLKRQALLFSRVTVIVPRPGHSADLPASIAQFASHLSRMLDLKPLVEDRTVELLPLYGFYSDEIEGGAGIVRSACENDPTIREWVTSQASALADFARTARQGDPFFDAGIRICSALTYGHTFAATHPFVGGLYKQLLTDAPRVDRSRIATTQLLDQIDLPGFANLTWTDIKSVRDNEECLARWRADLQVAISSVDPDLPPDKFVDRFDSQVQAQLARAALDLDRELASSSAMARFKKGGSSLALSAVAAAGKVTLGGPAAIWTEVLNVFRKDGPKEAIRLMWERKGQTGRRALRSHYAVFSTKER
jgi:hypothetical protein